MHGDIFNCDPHPGNLLVEHGSGDLIVLDWGQARRLGAAERSAHAQLFLSIMMEDVNLLGDACAGLGAPFADRKIDARVVAEAADRARLAKKLADAERHAARDRAGRDWARRAADAADLVLDDDAAVEAGGSSQRDLDAMLEEAGASRPQGRMAVVNADTLRMLAEERERGDAGPRPRDKKRRKKRK